MEIEEVFASTSVSWLIAPGSVEEEKRGEQESSAKHSFSSYTDLFVAVPNVWLIKTTFLRTARLNNPNFLH